jgi:hypothetical protein
MSMDGVMQAPGGKDEDRDGGFETSTNGRLEDSLSSTPPTAPLAASDWTASKSSATTATRNNFTPTSLIAREMSPGSN